MSECDCIFCNSKCPECGSIDIEFKYKAVFQCENTEQDEITLEHDEDEVELQCRNCGGWIEEPGYSVNNRLGGLSMALDRALDLPCFMTLTHKKGGKIKAEAIRFQSAKDTE
jgi:hypothetical protein